MLRITRLLAAAALLATACAGTAVAQTGRILVTAPPGGAVDALGRLFTDKLTEATGRPFVVENRVGGSGIVAAQGLKAAPVDGYTMMVATNAALTLYPHTVRKPAYDVFTDFMPVAHLGSYDSALAVGPAAPVTDLKGWVAWAKKDRKNASYGSPAVASNQQFLGFMLGQAADVEVVHIAYKGVGPAINELLGGHVPAIMMPLDRLIPLHKSGKLRVLAASGPRRPAAAPDIPTFRELGYPSLEVSGWYVMIMAAGTRPETVARYNDVFIQAMRTEAVRERMRAIDLDIHEMTPAEMAAKLKSEYERWGPVVKASGFTADN